MNEPIDQLVGLGPKSSAWLAEVGIMTRADLARVGVVEAYRKTRDAGHNVSLNLLWALEGAMTDTHWTMVTPRRKQQLKNQLMAADA